MKADGQYVGRLENFGLHDVLQVGGKNASLGEMIRTLKKEGIDVPDGFATTAEAYWKFIEHNGLHNRIQALLEKLKNKKERLDRIGKSIRRLFLRADFPDEISSAALDAYRDLCRRFEMEQVDVAVRSSATAEDLPEASFAGQQETFLNVVGEEEILASIRKCYASLFTDRAIVYRDLKGFDHMKVALSVSVQKMVRSDKASAGVMFSLDTETGFNNVVVINAAWGLGENVVQGTVTPDEYRVFKFLLHDERLKPIIEKNVADKEVKMIYAKGDSRSVKNVHTSKEERRSPVLADDEILKLARWACLIERHYGTPMDIEWAKDGDSGNVFIVQARPETVQSQKTADAFKEYHLKEAGDPILTGLSIGQAIAAGKVCRVKSAEDIDQFEEGSVLVTQMTAPDWVPVMKKAVGIVTDYGGRTCHAAIVSRELGVPAIVGTGQATELLETGQEVTISGAEGETGCVYSGILEFDVTEVNVRDIHNTRTHIMMNIADPDAAMKWWRLPCEGIGLARIEFIINNIIKMHPMALVRFDQLQDDDARETIKMLTQGYPSKTEYFVENLSLGIAKIAASQYPNQVIVRMSDFKTNEYADLIGGKQFEPDEKNPMLGFRGASRYYSDKYREGFALECRAVKRVREEMGLDNVIIMIPFCRTLEEADKVLEVLGENGLKRGENGLLVYVMAEIPSNVILASDFAARFDGFSIGSNDLTQLVLGVDRDSADLSYLFDERNQAVKRLIVALIESAHKAGCKVGICGQAPSDYPDFADFLVEAGIDSISLNPDSVIPVKRRVARTEEQKENPSTTAP